MKGVYTFCRYFAALLIIQYGFAKVNDAQFTVLQSVLDQPLREVSGFWLTWYYFGYSEVYGNLIALVQIAGGVMLLFRKTTLLGACLLLGVMANIVLVKRLLRHRPRGNGCGAADNDVPALHPVAASQRIGSAFLVGAKHAVPIRRRC